jgi:hypothetical protein
LALKRGTRAVLRNVTALLVIPLFAIAQLAALAAETPLANVKFSADEITLLKRINQIQTGAGMAMTVLKASPFVTLMGSPNPIDMAITIGSNDWDQIYGSLTALQKISACQIVKEIDLWHDADGNSYSSAASEQFFSNLRHKADRDC